jgi:hypothetical protein
LTSEVARVVAEATSASFRANWAFFSRCSLLGCFLRMCVVAIMGHSTFLLVGQRRLMSGGGSTTVGKNVVEVVVDKLPGGKEP